MKKIIYLITFLFVSVSLVAQSISTELTYLTIVNRQEKKLIQNNLRNAEIVADSLLLHPKVSNRIYFPDGSSRQKKHDSIGAFFFKELGMSYYITGNYPMALFSFMRQRILYPNDTLQAIVHYYFTNAAAFANVKKGIANYLLEKSSPATMHKKSFSEKKIVLLEKAIFLNSKALNSILLQYVDAIRESEGSVPQFINRWAFLVTIGIPHNKMEGYMNYYQGNLDSLNFQQKKILNRKAARYYLQKHAWIESNKYLNSYQALPLKLNNKITYGWLRLRMALRW